MERQQQAPILQPFFMGRSGNINPIWQRWFQLLKTRDDEVRRRPYKTYSASQVLTTWELGKSVLFATGTSNLVCTLPSVEEKDIWSWITIIRTGTGSFRIATSDSDTIERGGKILGCREPNRLVPNVTLQLVEVDSWAITGATGAWSLMPY